MTKTSATKWSVIKSAFNNASTRVSDNARTFALSGIGIIWLFKKEIKVDDVTTYELDNALALAAGLIFLFLITDFLQYLYKTIAWHYYKRKMYGNKDEPNDTDTILVWHHINAPVSVIFYVKCVLLAVAYWQILYYLYSIIKLA
ncbi:MAG: hypothetical protein LAT53_11895 [Idiomarina sp.]|nr:hypothetical protein [Idiomarina sp.]